MTSCSATEVRVSLLLAFALVSSACAEQSIEETQTLVFAESEACAVAAASGVRVNHYRAILFAFNGFDEESGELIDAASNADTGTGNTAPMPVDDADTDDGSDWIVNIAEDTDATVAGDLAASTDTSTSIDWDAEASEVNDLLPPPPSGRSGMKHEGAPAA